MLGVDPTPSLRAPAAASAAAATAAPARPPLDPGLRLPGSVAGRLAALLIAIVSILSVVDSVLTAVLVDPGTSFAAWSALVGPADLVAIVTLIGYVGAAVTFFIWLYKTTKATPDLAAGSADHGPAASVIWWFVPIASLFMPYLIMARLYSRLELPSHRARGWLPVVWWLAFLGSSITAIFAVGGVDTAVTAAELRDAVHLYGISSVFDVVAALAVIWLIVEIERLKSLRAGTLASSRGVVLL